VPFDDQMEVHCKTVLNKPYNTFSEIRVEKWKDGINQERINKILSTVGDISRQMGYRL
jgi:hypothetical protein